MTVGNIFFRARRLFCPVWTHFPTKGRRPVSLIMLDGVQALHFYGYNVAFYAGYKHFSALTGEKKENMYKYDWCE